MLKTILLKLYAGWVLFILISFMLLLLPFMISPIIFGEISRKLSFFAIKMWATSFARLSGIRYQAKGTHHLTTYPAFIYVCNHTSFLDSPAMPLFIPGQFRPLGKKELGKIPVLGMIVKTVCVMVDRSSAESRKKSVEKLMRLIKQGISIFIFPEGTMNRSSHTLKPFYDGAFRMAIETKAPIMPMVVVNAGKLLPPGTGNVKPGVVIAKFAAPIETDGLTHEDVPIIKAKAFEVMEKMILEEEEGPKETSV